ncbi:unnamed protein product [Heligmosomoides polygyrus]|uniref:Amino acid permease/ SLC12A domain-containing protein n=1 Tax=Heligmosomoides polygyrus TaxID=6339 RepID=A0A3P7WIK5_HELPZ|nr:unnamed protein product [Heligmosomoides polygyrus]
MLESIGEEASDDPKGARKFTSFGHLALYKQPEEDDQQASFISAFTTPGPKERATSNHKKANLGVLLGVYLPTIQHILGVTMFIRLFWVVGMAGLWWTLVLLAICCLCTLLTSISLSAVATNGVVESGGAYFIISRNLGAEFGSAVGILFYLANTVAASMYIVGGVEVLLMYIVPDMAIGGREALHDTDPLGPLYNNYRIYGTLFLIIQVLIVAMGVKFVQLLAPVSLLCVILAILACFAGGVEKAITAIESPVKCISIAISISLKRSLDKNRYASFSRAPIAIDIAVIERTMNTPLSTKNVSMSHRQPSSLHTDNLDPGYMQRDEVLPGVPGKQNAEVVQDVTSTFFLLLAIYFPAVTGIMTGTNMSGDLKDPQRSIPSGTIAATVTTSIIYYALAILFAASVDRSVLRDKFGRSIDNNMVVSTLAWPSPLVVTVGSFLSTFGAALQCLCSAPRLLQSIAKDDVIPILSPFARVTAKNEPLLGLLLTTFIAELAILLGAVDKIAEFRFLSLLGALLCFFIMFASDWRLALLACGITFVIYKYVEWKGAKKEWGDGMRGLALTTAQYSLLKVEDKDPHPKNWRPQLLICLSTHWSKELIDLRAMSMLNLAAQLKAGQGLAIAVAFLKQSSDSAKDKAHAQDVKDRLTKDMVKARLRGFGKTIFYTLDQMSGCVSTLYQSIGIGGLRPNTVLLNWPKMEDTDEVDLFTEKLICGVTNENCVLVAKGITEFPDANDRLIGYIDIWWVVMDGGILMLIAYLLKQHKVWRGCALRIFAIGDNDPSKSEEIRKGLQKYIYMLRIDADVFMVNLLDLEVSDEVLEKTAELEKRQQSIKNEIRVSRFGLDGNLGSLLVGREESWRGALMTTDESSLQVHKMNTAIRLNHVIIENSPSSQLVLLNLPRPPKNRGAFQHNYMVYLDVLTENLQRVLFIGGSGKEVISIA